jgi:hypothetical protein
MQSINPPDKPEDWQVAQWRLGIRLIFKLYLKPIRKYLRKGHYDTDLGIWVGLLFEKLGYFQSRAKLFRKVANSHFSYRNWWTGLRYETGSISVYDSILDQGIYLSLKDLSVKGGKSCGSYFPLNRFHSDYNPIDSVSRFIEIFGLPDQSKIAMRGQSSLYYYKRQIPNMRFCEKDGREVSLLPSALRDGAKGFYNDAIRSNLLCKDLTNLKRAIASLDQIFSETINGRSWSAFILGNL